MTIKRSIFSQDVRTWAVCERMLVSKIRISLELRSWTCSWSRRDSASAESKQATKPLQTSIRNNSWKLIRTVMIRWKSSSPKNSRKPHRRENPWTHRNCSTWNSCEHTVPSFLRPYLSFQRSQSHQDSLTSNLKTEPKLISWSFFLKRDQSET